MSKLIRGIMVVALAAFTLGIASSRAHAAGGSTLGCTVYDVGVDVANSTASPRLTLHCLNDVNTYTINYNTCTPMSPDTVKIWQSIISSSLMSGKKLNVWWDNACGTRALTSVFITSVP